MRPQQQAETVPPTREIIADGIAQRIRGI